MNVPHYRILIWTKTRKKPFNGIRWIDNPSIDNVYRIYETKSKEKYRFDFIDIEVHMLSKLCTAVFEHLEDEEKKRQKREELRKHPPINKNLILHRTGEVKD